MSPTRPNILYIHSHDTGCYVQPYGFQVPTPNIQLLADQGVLFRKAFSAAPTCSGSRAALLTGRHCHMNGMLGLAHRGWDLSSPGEHLIHPLADVGYYTAMVGEQHISRDPHILGYDYVAPLPADWAASIVPTTLEVLDSIPEPFFLSVGFFETHREYGVPTSVRDTLYSLPPANLPDNPITRRDMAAFKASARSLDQGIGAVLNGLYTRGLAERTLIVCTTDHGLAFPGAKATLYDSGIRVLMLMRGPSFFGGGKVVDAMVSHLDIYPTLCEVAGAEKPDFLRGSSLIPLLQGEVDRLNEQIFTEVTFHAAYEPQRAVRTERWKYIRRFDDYPYPVLANCDDSATKTFMIEAGWGDQVIPSEQLFDLYLDPGEARNLARDPDHQPILQEMRARLDHWMEETGDPLLDGPVEPPRGALINLPTQVSPEEPLTRVQ